MLKPHEGPPAAQQGYKRGDFVPEEDQATLRKAFVAAIGKAKVDAAIALCAAGGDDGLAFLKAEMSKDGAIAEMASRNSSWGHAAVEALGAHGGPKAIAMLKAILLEKSHPLRWRAGLALGRNASDAALDVLRTALKSADADEASNAACGLEMLGGKVGLELSALALAHVDPKVRRGGAFGAYRAHGERALPLLETALADPVPDVRKMVVNGLANIGGDKAADLIQRQLVIEKDPAVVKALKDAEAQLKK